MEQRSKATSVFLELYGLAPARADRDLLGRVAERFAQLPWENLTKYLKKHGPKHAPGDAPSRSEAGPDVGKLRLSAEVLEDHAAWGTGGTCFSLTNALRRIVTDLGFRAWPVMGDMRHGQNVHCGLVVEAGDGRYLLDPGYLVAEPVPFGVGVPVRIRQTGGELEYRPCADGGLALYSHNERDEHVARYRLRPAPVADGEFLRFWLRSFDSPGMNGLHLNRVTSEGRLSAHDLNLRIDTGREKRNVKLRDRYVEQVSDRFGMDGEIVGRAFARWEQRRWRGR